MEENKKPLPSQEQLNIYSARLKFAKKKNGQVFKEVRVYIRYSKKGSTRKKDIKVPNYINTDELNWIRYRGKTISVYHRISNGQNHDYVDNRRISVHTALCQKLEKLVNEVHFKKKNLSNSHDEFYNETGFTISESNNYQK